MGIKNLRNVYYEKELDELISDKTKELKLDSKSRTIRVILKKEFSKCLNDECYADAIASGYCQKHLEEIKKSIGGNQNGKWRK